MCACNCCCCVWCLGLPFQERRIAELESQVSESQQQLETARSNRSITQEALDQVSGYVDVFTCCARTCVDVCHFLLSVMQTCRP